MYLNLERIDPLQIIKPIRAKSHTPPYKIHKYFARRPWNVFDQMIEAVSEEGELILDPFCGGGVSVYEGYKLNRSVIGFDVNPLSGFIVENMVKCPNIIEELESAVVECEVFIDALYGEYDIQEINSKQYLIDWYELTYVVECNFCHSENLLSNEFKISNGKYLCQNRKCQSNKEIPHGFHAKDCQRLRIKYLFQVSKSGQKKYVSQVELLNNKKIEKHIVFLRNKAKSLEINLSKTKIPKAWDRQFEDQLEKKGIIYFEDLFTERNYYINKLLLWKIKSYSKRLSQHNYSLLRLIFSNVLKESNIMSFTNDTWQGGKPTTWSKHAYWLPSQFCEVNIKSVFRNSVKRIFSSLEYNKIVLRENPKVSFVEDSQDFNIKLLMKSIEDCSLNSNSIDAIVTDPPYGSNVQYLELSHFWYVWNNDMYHGQPAFQAEAISNRKKFSGSKTMKTYEDNLYKVFKESFRVLKKDRYMTLTFNNKDISAWLALLISIFRSGFTFVPNGLVFQDGVENYKNTSHTKAAGSPFGDFIYVFTKNVDWCEKKNFDSENDFTEFIDRMFKSHLNTESTIDKNEIKREMFLDVIPYIQNFVFYSIDQLDSHGLYNHFNKNYFKKLYN